MANKFKKGDKVKMINCGEAKFYEGQIWECRGDSFIVGEGVYRQELVFLVNFSGRFACQFLEKIEGQQNGK